jgi:pimeloyl-ACP methyl ester carboxylesterase
MAPLLARAFGRAAAAAIPVRRRAAALADLDWGRRVLMSPGTADPAALPPAEVRAMLAASAGATRIAEALTTVAAADLRPLLGRLAVPVGLLWGSRDRIIPPGGLDTALAVRPEAPFAVIDGAGHIPMMERPEAFAGALGRVLEALSQRGHIRASAAP